MSLQSNRGKSTYGDADFYSSLAADASDVESGSDADPTQMVKSFGALDDMDDDILGSLKKKPQRFAVSKSMPSGSRPFEKKPPITPSHKEKDFDLDDILSKPDPSLDELLISKRPQTTPNQASKSEVTHAKPRPATTGRTKPSFDFGEFDEDDPLAGLGLDSDDDLKHLNKSGSKQLPKASQQPPKQLSQSSPEVERPKTSSGSRIGPTVERLPIKQRIGKKTESDEGSWDDSSQASDSRPTFSGEPPVRSKDVAQIASVPKSSLKRKEDITFSDDDDLDLGLDDPPPKRLGTSESQKSSFMDSLFNKSAEVDKHLQRPGTGGSHNEDAENGEANPATRKSKPTVTGGDDDEIFGSYAPSALGGTGSRPGTGRSVRFEDEEPKRPATAEFSTKTTQDEDWLGLETPSKKQRPLGMASSIDFSGRAGKAEHDWLEMATGSKPLPTTASNDKTAVDAQPVRPAEKKPVAKKVSADDWLNELTTKFDDEYLLSPEKPAETVPTKQKSSATSKSALLQNSPVHKPKPAVTADDWLGLGDEQPVKVPSLGVRRNSLKQETPQPTSATGTPVAEDADDWLNKSLIKKKVQRVSNKDELFSPPKSFPTLNQGLESPKSAVQLPVEPFPLENRSANQQPQSQNQPIPIQQQYAPPSLLQSPPSLMQPPIPQQYSQPVLPQPSMQQAAANYPIIQPSQPPSFVQLLDHNRQVNGAEHGQQLLQQMQQLIQVQMSLAEQKKSESLQSSSEIAEQSGSQVKNKIDLDGMLRRLEQEKIHLESIISSLKMRHQDELSFIETSNKSRVLMIEETYQRREQRLREEIELITAELTAKSRLAEESRASLISSHYRKLEELNEQRRHEMERLRHQHSEQLSQLSREHNQMLDRLRISKEQEMEALVATQSNPNQIRVLMEQLRSNTNGLTEMQTSVRTERESGLEEREAAVAAREQQVKVLQECLLKQQDENDKDRSRIQESAAKSEVQHRELERQLHQEKWSVSQERSKLAALQMTVDQERAVLNEQITRERAEVNKAKDMLMNEQRAAMLNLAQERRLISEDRSKLTLLQEELSNKGRTESIKASQGSAHYEGLISAANEERDKQASLRKELETLTEQLRTERATLNQERAAFEIQQRRNAELAETIQIQSKKIEEYTKECTDKEARGMTALSEAKILTSEHSSRLQDITTRLTDLQATEKRVAEDQLNLARERKRVDSLRNMQLCIGCKQPLTNNPFFSLSTSALRQRPGTPSVGIVSPQRLAASDPTMIEYQIQAKQDKRYLDEETMYLDTLRLSTYATNAS